MSAAPTAANGWREYMGFCRKSKKFAVKSALGSAAHLCDSAVALICILALKQLVGSNDSNTLYFLTDSGTQILEESRGFFIRDVMVARCACNLGTEITNPVIKPASGHMGECASAKNARIS